MNEIKVLNQRLEQASLEIAALMAIIEKQEGEAYPSMEDIDLEYFNKKVRRAYQSIKSDMQYVQKRAKALKLKKEAITKVASTMYA